jgi:hypothetical protein
MTQTRASAAVFPYLVLVALLALVTTCATLNLVASALEVQLREEQAGAGLAANQAMVRAEASNLAVLRQMLFTVGVDDAVAAHDGAALERLLGPVVVNARVPYADVYGADGSLLLALRSPDLGADAAQRVDPDAPAWAPIQAVLHGDSDDQGDKYAAVVTAPWGPLFVTSGHVERDNQLLGAIAVALPLDEVVTRLSEGSGSKTVTLYRPDGSVVASSRPGAPSALQQAPGLSPAEAETALIGDRVVVRRLAPGGEPAVETVGVLAIRRQPALLLGVSSGLGVLAAQEAAVRNLMLVIFGVAVPAVVAIGLRLAWQADLPGGTPSGRQEAARPVTPVRGARAHDAAH